LPFDSPVESGLPNGAVLRGMHAAIWRAYQIVGAIWLWDLRLNSNLALRDAYYRVHQDLEDRIGLHLYRDP
jgi:hypothetical protein